MVRTARAFQGPCGVRDHRGVNISFMAYLVILDCRSAYNEMSMTLHELWTSKLLHLI